MNKFKLFNMALSYIGDSYYIENGDVSDGSHPSILCNLFLDSAISAVEEMHDWPFLSSMDDIRPLRVDLIPNFFCYKVLPHIRKVDAVSTVGMPKLFGSEFEVIASHNNTNKYQKVLVSRKELMLFKYVSHYTNSIAMPQSFMDAVALKLASLIAGSLVQGAQGIQIADACDKRLANLLSTWQEDIQTQASDIARQPAQWIQNR